MEEVIGVRIPDSRPAALARELIEAKSALLANHSLRTYVMGAKALVRIGERFDEEAAFVACMLHDVGLIPEFESPGNRFEVDGADFAVRFLEDNGIGGQKAEIVWDAIALHSTGQIPMRKSPEAKLVHFGAGADVLGAGAAALSQKERDQLVTRFPRLDFKRAFMATIVDHVRRKGSQGGWVGEIARAHGIPSPTADEVIMRSIWSE